MRAAGAPEDVIAAKVTEWAARNPPPEPLEVHPENIAAFRVFWAVRAQWEMPGMHGGRCTVPFADIDIAIERLRVRRPRDCFRRVTTMLLAARKVLLERHNRELTKTKGRTRR